MSASRTGGMPGLPMGFAEQVMELQMRLQQQESLELIQILSQMYRIAVDYYLNNDVRKAKYFQNKLNILAVKSLNATSVEKKQSPKIQLEKKIKSEMDKFKQNERILMKSMVEKSQKSQKRIKECVKADLQKQQQFFQSRMLKRVKSTGKL